MAIQELTWKVSVDPAIAAQAMRELASESDRSTRAIEANVRREAQAAIALQRQRSAALISEWKRETRESEAEQRAQARAAEALQRQRSAAIIASWRAQERERVAEARRAEQQIQREAQESQRRRSAFFAGIAGGATALIGVSAINEIRQGASAWLDYSSKLETTRIAFIQMLGSEQAAEQHLRELQAFALKTPFQFADLIDASQRMQALGFNAQQVIPILTDVGNAVAAAGGGAERLDRVTLALSQMQSKGKVATQEMNQLAESGIPAWKVLEQQFGKSRAELVKMVEQGQISSQVFLEAFQKFSQQNFGGLMEQQSKTFQGALSNIKDALLQTSETAFKPLYERLNETAQRLNDLSTNSKEFRDNMKAVGDFLVFIWDAAAVGVRAFKLAIADLVTQTVVLIDLTQALIRLLESEYHDYIALAQVIVGDVVGAMQSYEKSQIAFKLAANSMGDAMNAQKQLAHEIASAWEDSARRTSAAAMLMNTVTVQASVNLPPSLVTGSLTAGAGITRQRQPSVGGGGGAATPKDEMASYKNIVDSLNLSLQFYGKTTEHDKVEQEFLRAGIEKLNPALRAQADAYRIVALQIADTLDIKRRIADEEERQAEQAKQEAEAFSDFIKAQQDAIRELSGIERTAIDDVNDFMVAYVRMGGVLSDDQIETVKFNASLIELGKTLKKISESDANEFSQFVKELGDEIDADIEKAKKFHDFLIKAADRAMEPGKRGQQTSAVDQLFDQINENLTGDRQTAALAGLNALSTGFEALGQAAAQALGAFILYGSAGTSFRKFAAEVIAAIAQMAVVKAIFELAEGLAALARGFFFGDPKAAEEATLHFHSAAMYGAIAGIAALAGRAVAGNSFQSATGSGGGAGNGSNSRSGNNQSNNANPSPVVLGSQRPPQAVHVTVDLVPNRVFDARVVSVVVTDANTGGPTRNVIRQEIRRQE